MVGETEITWVWEGTAGTELQSGKTEKVGREMVMAANQCEFS